MLSKKSMHSTKCSSSTIEKSPQEQMLGTTAEDGVMFPYIAAFMYAALFTGRSMYAAHPEHYNKQNHTFNPVSQDQLVSVFTSCSIKIIFEVFRLMGYLTDSLL